MSGGIDSRIITWPLIKRLPRGVFYHGIAVTDKKSYGDDLDPLIDGASVAETAELGGIVGHQILIQLTYHLVVVHRIAEDMPHHRREQRAAVHIEKLLGDTVVAVDESLYYLAVGHHSFSGRSGSIMPNVTSTTL